jgi:hypothetical protein
MCVCRLCARICINSICKLLSLLIRNENSPFSLRWLNWICPWHSFKVFLYLFSFLFSLARFRLDIFISFRDQFFVSLELSNKKSSQRDLIFQFLAVFASLLSWAKLHENLNGGGAKLIEFTINLV